MTLLKRATIKSYDAGSHRADVGILGSLSVWLAGIAVSDSIPAAAVVAGRECAVLFHTEDNPDDAVVVSVTGGGPPASGGGDAIWDADTDTGIQAEEGSDDDTLRFDTAGVEQATLDSSGKWKWNAQAGHAFGSGISLTSRAFNYATAGAYAQGLYVWSINPNAQATVANQLFAAVEGNFILTAVGVNVTRLAGLTFGVLSAASGTPPTFVESTAVIGGAGSFGAGTHTVTDLSCFRANDSFTNANATYTRMQALWSNLGGKSQATTMTALRIRDITAGTNKFLIWAGPNTPSATGVTNLRLDAGNPPDAALTTEGDSQLHLTFMENGALAMRQVRWRQQSSLGATDKVLIAQ